MTELIFDRILIGFLLGLVGGLTTTLIERKK